MELLAIIVQVVKDLLGNLNPFKLVSQSYRRQFADLWQKEGWVFKIGYVIGGALLVLLLLSLLLLALHWVTEKR